MTNGKVTLNGKRIDFDAAAMLMDDDIREAIHNAIAPCTDQEFMDAYARAHEEEFGEEFSLD